VTPRTIVVVAYDEAWPSQFEELRARIWPSLADVALAVEHVGSTAVPGLAAKPIIDMTVVTADRTRTGLAIARLGALGYRHRGDLGIEGREALDHPATRPRHNLYVCVDGVPALVNHLRFRDYLRIHSRTARAYGELKQQLAAACGGDIDQYVHGKTSFIASVLLAAGVDAALVSAIERLNRA